MTERKIETACIFSAEPKVQHRCLIKNPTSHACPLAARDAEKEYLTSFTSFLGDIFACHQDLQGEEFSKYKEAGHVAQIRTNFHYSIQFFFKSKNTKAIIRLVYSGFFDLKLSFRSPINGMLL